MFKFYKKSLSNRGLTLIELAIAIGILFIIIVPLANVFTKGIRGVINFGDTVKGTQLAQELMEEIKQKKWDETEPQGGGATPEASYSTPIGREAGETNPDGTGANGAKLTWDDIDDYDGLIEKPPRDVQNNIIPKTDKFTRNAWVRYVTIGDNPPIIVTPLVAGTTHYKEITVSVDWEGRTGPKPVIIRNVRSNYKRY